MLRLRSAVASLVLLCVLAPACATAEVPTPSIRPTAPSPQHPTPSAEDPTPSVIIGDVTFGAELVTTPADRARGLSGRDSLPAKSGMLFIFESRVASAFWMKEMRFPLDFVWISRDCEVVDITREVPAPAPGTTDAELKLYASVVTSAYVFEINAGEAAAHGIAFGAAVRFSGVPAELGATCG